MLKFIIFCLLVIPAAQGARLLCQQEPQQPVDARGPTCAICEALVKEMFKFVKNNRTEIEIEEALTKVCNLIYKKGPNREQCDEMVQAYTKEIVKLLIDETDPQLICMLIDQCIHVPTYKKVNYQSSAEDFLIDDEEVEDPDEPIETTDSTSNKPPVSIGEFITMLDSNIPLNSMRTCVECKLFITYLQETFQSPKTRDQLKDWLLVNLCQSLAEQQIIDSCKSMVNQYSDAFFKAIAEQLDPKVVCEDLKACRKRKHVPIEVLEENMPLIIESLKHEVTMQPFFTNATSFKNPICDQCVDIIKRIDDYLSKYPVDKDVKIIIDQVCNKIPDQAIKDNCAEVVKSIGQNIVDAIHTMDNPRQLCSKLTLC